MKRSVLLMVLMIVGVSATIYGQTPGSETSPPSYLLVHTGPVVDGATVTPSIVKTTESFVAEVTATGDEPLGYQWKLNGTAIIGAESATYTKVSATLSDAGDYVCTVTSSFGVSTDSLPASLSVQQMLVFTQQPQDADVIAGESLILSASASGVGAISYQWRRNSVDIFGATLQAYYVGAATPANAGDYTVVATDNAVPPQVLESSVAHVTVNVLSPTLSLTHADGAADMTAVFNNNGAVIQTCVASQLPTGTAWSDVVAMGIDHVNKTTWVEVLEEYGIAITPNTDTVSQVFIGAGIDWSGLPAQVSDPLTLMTVDEYVLPWFRVSTDPDPSRKYFFNTNVVVLKLNGVDLNKAAGYYLLQITN